MQCQNGAGIYEHGDCPRFGQPGNYLANNRAHHVDFHNTLTSTGDAAQWVLDNRFPSIDFTWVWVDGTDYDVRIIDDYYPTASWAGRTTCPSGPTGGTSPNRECYGQKISLNLSQSAQWNTVFGRHVLLCHELGHTVGMNHPNGGYVNTTCLEDERTPDNSESAAYDTADRDNVSDGY